MISLTTTPLKASGAQARRKRIPPNNFTPVFMSKYCESADRLARLTTGAGVGDGAIEPPAQCALVYFHLHITDSDSGRAESLPRQARSLNYERRTTPEVFTLNRGTATNLLNIQQYPFRQPTISRRICAARTTMHRNG